MKQFPEVRFCWWRHPKQLFKLRMREGHRVIALDDLTELREFEMHFPLTPGAFKPLVSAPAGEMLLAFARIEEAEDALDFVNRFGPLTGAGRSLKGERVSVITEAAGDFRELIEAVADGDPAAEEIIGTFDFGELQTWLIPTSPDPKEPDPKEPEKPKKLKAIFNVPSLLDALRFMLAHKLAGGGSFRRCPYKKCEQPIFDVGESTGRTLKTVYCSTEHQISHNREIRVKKGK